MDEQTNKNILWNCIRGASTDRWPRKNRDRVLNMQGGARKAKAHLELSLSKDIKCSRQSFYGGVSSKRKSRENVEDCSWMAQGIGGQMCARGKGTQCLCCLSLLVGLGNPETVGLVEKHGAAKTYLWCEGGSNKGTFKQSQHAQVHGTWWAASTSVEGAVAARLLLITIFGGRVRGGWGRLLRIGRQQIPLSSWRRAKKCEELQVESLTFILRRLWRKKNLETTFEHFVVKVIGSSHRVRKGKSCPMSK